MTNERCVVAEHAEIGAGYRYLVLEAPQMASGLVPGQFVHVRVPALEDSALRRPFSVFDAADGRVTLLYKVVGRGTQALGGVRAGDDVSVLGPLGRGFPLACEGVPLFVGGGYGVAPLHFLAARFAAAGLPTALPDGLTFESLAPLMRGDKKRAGSSVTFALPCANGDVRAVPVDLA